MKIGSDGDCRSIDHLSTKHRKCARLVQNWWQHFGIRLLDRIFTKHSGTARLSWRSGIDEEHLLLLLLPPPFFAAGASLFMRYIDYIFQLEHFSSV